MNILELFENSVKRYPEKIAVVDEDEELSFLSLKKKALSLANAIKKSIAGEDNAIGIFVDRNVNSIVSIIGVLYSGNYYVPLDNKTPINKIKTIIEETKMKIIVDLNDLASKPLEDNILYINNLIDNDKQTIDLEGFDGERPLYMIYTSGSTGKPKGVLKSHEAMISFINAYVDKFKFDENEIIGNQSPFFFDASAKDYYLMMAVASKMVIIPNKLFSSPYNLINYLNDKKISFISWVPSMLSIIVKVNTFDDVIPQTLKKVFFVGEAFPIKYLKIWLEKLPNIKYVNLFGSSEIAGVFSTYEISELKDELFLPLGKALDNCEILLVNETGEVIKEKEELGEMYVSSKALATCYYNDEEKTNDKFFFTDKYSGEIKRYFKTGDIAKYDNNGNLVFVTRKDFQIKKMGHRIELGEIESIANMCPLIKQSCCIYLEEKQHLKLYCEVFDDSTTSKDLMPYLKENLSDYMWPNKVIILKELPLNANGKINRKALKELG